MSWPAADFAVGDTNTRIPPVPAGSIGRKETSNSRLDPPTARMRDARIAAPSGPVNKTVFGFNVLGSIGTLNRRRTFWIFLADWIGEMPTTRGGAGGLSR